MIIIDMGSGETCRNDVTYIKRMIDELREVDSGTNKIVIKWQLFAQETVPYLQPLSLLSFDEAYRYGQALGYETTASVFDTWSLSKLLQYDVPFVKLACRPWVYPLLGISSMMERQVVVSVSDAVTGTMLRQQWPNVKCLCCVPEYPALDVDYDNQFDCSELQRGISDHTIGWQLYDDHAPDIYECHYKLDDSTGPDAASFARTPAMLEEIL